MNLIDDSKKHCSDANENYFQHMAVAQKISFELLKASLMAFSTFYNSCIISNQCK